MYVTTDGPLGQMPWPEGQTKLKMPNKWFFNSKDPTFHNLSHPFEMSNVQVSSFLLTLAYE